MLVSIVVTSYNYGRFLAEAIDSCLAQTHPDTEIVVVDDGSTDDSRRIIESYGSAIVPVLKDNGGHASAINAGFAKCRGELVCPLDSDDRFEPGKVAAIVDAWRARPQAYLLYHQLQTIDGSGTRMGGPWPAATWNGDIADRIRRSGGWWPRPTTSGLCFSRAYLERVLPMPTGPRIWPDTYLAPPAALSRPVIGLREALGAYRVHGRNTILRFFPSARSPEERRAIAQRRVEQFMLEQRLLAHCLARLFDHPPSITLDEHPDFQRFRRIALARPQLLRVLGTIATSRAIPSTMKLRELARAVVKPRGD
jgi:hypothetical protein